MTKMIMRAAVAHIKVLAVMMAWWMPKEDQYPLEMSARKMDRPSIFPIWIAENSILKAIVGL